MVDVASVEVAELASPAPLSACPVGVDVAAAVEPAGRSTMTVRVEVAAPEALVAT